MKSIERADILTPMAKQLPRVVEMRSLPEGRYVIEDIGPARTLSLVEDAGLRQALSSIREGRTKLAAVVHAKLRGLIKKKGTKTARGSTAHR